MGLSNRHLDSYARGLADEVRVVQAIRCLGMGEVIHCEDRETQLKDIDVYVDGVPCSIKAQHAGEAYGNIYVELATEVYQPFQWTQETTEDYMKAIAAEPGSGFIKYPSAYVRPGWWYGGEAGMFFILQGDTLTCYHKRTIAAYIKEHGFLRVRGLSRSVYAGQQGRNTWCGYLPNKGIPFYGQWSISDLLPDGMSTQEAN
jgi:hypothetical protein